jgi:acylphosphatase
MADLASMEATVSGRVQGVFFRAFVQRRARELGLKGYTRNLPNGSVEVRAEGEKDKLEKLVEYLRSGPPAARVDEVRTTWGEYSGNYREFMVAY